jgi:hypothetical protein
MALSKPLLSRLLPLRSPPPPAAGPLPLPHRRRKRRLRVEPPPQAPNSRPTQRAAGHELSRRLPRGQGGRVLPPGVKDHRQPPLGEAPTLCFGARRGRACVGAALPRRAARDPPPLRAHQGDAAPSQSLPLHVLPLGPPVGRRRGCGLPPRRAQLGHGQEGQPNTWSWWQGLDGICNQTSPP